MSNDGEIEIWRRQWQGGATAGVEPAAIERLRRSVRRENFWSTWGLVFPILASLGSCAGVVIPALRSERPLGVWLGVESFVFIVVVWIVAFWLARGTWRPLADTTAAFIDVTIRRREAYIRGATAGACLYVAQFAILVLAMGLESPAGFGAVLTSTPVMVVGWIGMPVVFAGLYWFGLRQQADLTRLRELKRQLQSD